MEVLAMNRTMWTGLVAGLALIGVLVAQKPDAAQTLYQTAIKKEQVDGDLKGAIDQYKKVVQTANRVLAAQALLHMAECYRKLGDNESQKVYERVVKEYADQKEAVTVARARLGANGDPGSSDTLASRLVCECGDYETSMSADGRWIAYTDYSNGDIMLRDLSTGQEKRLMAKTEAYKDSVAYAEEPVFSPDLRQVVYNWQTGSGGARRERAGRQVAQLAGQQC
jgi:tetratricopeptide (TPR) repeat protein